MNKHIWENFKQNASRAAKIYKKHAVEAWEALYSIVIFIALNLTVIVAPFFWLYFAIFRDEEKYAYLVKSYDEKKS